MKCVLIAEDEASIRDFVVINLKRSGYEVIEAEIDGKTQKIFCWETDACCTEYVDFLNQFIREDNGLWWRKLLWME